MYARSHSAQSTSVGVMERSKAMFNYAGLFAKMQTQERVERVQRLIGGECNIQREQDARRQCACWKESYAINAYRTRKLLLTYCTVACAVRAGMAQQEAEQQLEEVVYHDAF